MKKIATSFFQKVIGIIIVISFSFSMNAYTQCRLLNENFDVNPVLSPTNTDGAWYPDRYRPAAFVSDVLAGNNVLKISIDGVADGAAGRPPGQQGIFYNTHGRKFNQCNKCVTVSKGDLWIPADWATDHRRSDMWATAYDATNAISAYPIIGFRNVDAVSPGIYFWDGNVGWINSGVAIAYNSWYSLGFRLVGPNIEYLVNNVVVGTIFSDGSTYFGDIIMQAYNFNDPTLPAINQSADSYNSYWDNLVTTGTNGNVVTNVNTGLSYCTIQTAIDDPLTLNGHIISVGAGTYNENVNLNKGVTLMGQGPSSTILTSSTACSGTGVTISATNAKLKDLTVTNYSNGIAVSSTGNEINNVASVLNCNAGLELSSGTVNLSVLNSKLNNNTSLGFRKGTAAIVSGFTMDNCEVKGNNQGCFVAKNNGAGGTFDNVSITNSNFSNNKQKGMYFEALSNAMFDKIIMDNSGTDPGYNNNAGIDINLKYGSYSNLTIKNCSISNCGVNGTAIDPQAASAFTIKARDDAPSYSGNPASLNSVYVFYNIISGPQNGLRIGEYGKTNTSPTNVSVYNNDFSASFANKAIINRTPVNTFATCNWYGTVDGAVIATKIEGPVTYDPWLTSGIDSDPATGFQPTGNCNGTSIDYDGDGVDNDDDCAPLDPEIGEADLMLWKDADGDGFGNPLIMILACGPTPGYVENNWDCDDTKTEKKPEDEKVIMCHKGKSECVKWKDVSKKQGDGWTLGPCTQSNCSQDETLMCNKGQTECVKNKDVQKKLNDGWTLGACTSPCNSDHTLMCDGKKMKCVKNKDVQKRLDKGWTVGYCPMNNNSRPIFVSEDLIAQDEKKPLVYPSPNTGQFTLKLPVQSAKAEIIITNSNGSVIERRSVNGINIGQTQNFDLRRNGPGMYFIRIVSAEGVQTSKVIVQR